MGGTATKPSIEAGVEPVFKYLSDLGITPKNGEGLAGYVVAANVCRRQMNSKRDGARSSSVGTQGAE